LIGELDLKRIAIEHTQTGVARVDGDGRFASVNEAFARALQVPVNALCGQEWWKMFPAPEQDRVHEAYRQAMLTGTASFDCYGARPDGSTVWLNVRLVAVHDANMRFIGHHCLIEDRTRERELERELSIVREPALAGKL